MFILNYRHSGDEAILEIFYVKGSSNLIGKENVGAKLMSKIVKLLEMTESIFYFCGYLS